MKKYLLIFLLVFIQLLLVNSQLISDPIVINEFMASNSQTIADEDGDYEDWIEIFNKDSVAHNLAGYHLSDDLQQPLRWVFPDTLLPAGEFLLVFASGKDRTGNELHTNFRISASGEPLILSSPGGVTLDYIEPLELETDISYGRIPDGGNNFYFFSETTPGFSNYEGTKHFVPNAELQFSKPGGFYEEAFDLFIMSSDSLSVIYYTTDGSVPDTSSYIFDTGLNIKQSAELPYPDIIDIVTTTPNGPGGYAWIAPQNEGFKANVIRARAFRGDTAVTEIYTHSYFIDEKVFNRFNLPVISISLDENALFDVDSGIFVAGTTYAENPETGFHWGTGNFHNRGQEWERSANFEYFEKGFEKILNQEIGVRIHGFGSRALPHKSLRLYARNLYGKNTFEHQFFEDDTLKSFRRLILRNSGQDFSSTMLADAVTHELVKDLDLEFMRYQPAVLFINGAYWGIVNIRERIDNNYLAARRNADPDNLDILENNILVNEGSYEHYLQMLDYLRSNPIFTESQFKNAEALMDVNNYIDYTIAKLYFGVYDWPGNNVRYWRENKVGSLWRWYFFDNDDAFKDVHFNSLEHATALDGPDWPNPEWSTELFRLLLNSEVFRGRFLERLAYHLSFTFSSKKVSDEITKAAEAIKAEMQHHIYRWNYPKDISSWHRNIDDMFYFAKNRPCALWEMAINFFELENDFIGYEICEDEDAYKPIIFIFPNPSNGAFSVNITTYKPSASGNIRISNMLGQIVYDESIIFTEGENFKDIKLPVSASPGIYQIMVTVGDDNTASSRFVTF
ncbi:MAG: T9SS C-terminal target domain-containing protein [Chitinophagaceae bacterium]|nr:MAG: T9SS C-terminal target domain-containing protein [Chitinophagaceae bacterium]